jgi:hypothetical protein
VFGDAGFSLCVPAAQSRKVGNPAELDGPAAGAVFAGKFSIDGRVGLGYGLGLGFDGPAKLGRVGKFGNSPVGKSKS